MTTEKEDIEEKQSVIPVVSLIVSNSSGQPVYLGTVGGTGLATVLQHAVELPDFPVEPLAPLDSVGQEIYAVTDRDYVSRISGTFTALTYSNLRSLLDTLKSGDLRYGFVVSY